MTNKNKNNELIELMIIIYPIDLRYLIFSFNFKKLLTHYMLYTKNHQYLYFYYNNFILFNLLNKIK